ncbi:hypothetical protein RhiirC2_792325 [Rhizophagus irregularis]|uniref:Uncharacterized protein n=1 Tax=Rhizophagus irregularis TaxID=588596 RepID=A0A2N1MHP2_9GLOM|nr:hypothetical protein RhiirC2_792325 [Rhizophagus irregularis]
MEWSICYHNNTSANNNKYFWLLNATFTITATPIPMSSSFYFLGVWFNIMVHGILSQFLFCYSLTSQQVVYLHNMEAKFSTANSKAKLSRFTSNVILLRFIQFFFLIPISPLLVLDWSYWSSLTLFK